MNRFFLDTNVLVYSRDKRSPGKRDQARALLAKIKAGTCAAVISTQVLQNFTTR